MIDWVISAVSVHIQRLRRGERDGLHPDRVDLCEAAEFAVVRAVYGVVEVGRRTSVVTRETLVIRCQRTFGIQRPAKWKMGLFADRAQCLICDQPCAQSIRMIVFPDKKTLRQKSPLYTTDNR